MQNRIHLWARKISTPNTSDDFLSCTSFIADATGSCCVGPTAPLLPRQEHVVTASFQASCQNHPCWNISRCPRFNCKCHAYRVPVPATRTGRGWLSGRHHAVAVYRSFKCERRAVPVRPAGVLRPDPSVFLLQSCHPRLSLRLRFPRPPSPL